MAIINPKSKAALLFGIAVAALVAGRCIWLWQPQRQLERHQAALLSAVGDRDWKKLDALIDPAFRHPGGYDKAWLLKEAGEVRRHFFSLTVNGELPHYRLAPGRDGGTVESLIRLEGSGTAIAQYVMSEASSNREPFVFTWAKKSWKPWDWQLTLVEHPLIERAHRSRW